MTNPLRKLGFGGWQIGGVNFVDGRHTGWGEIDRREALNAVLFALDNGISFFDTSDAYGKGQSEEIIGEALSLRPDIPTTICTKFGSRIDAYGNSKKDYSGSWVQEAVENSLRRLNRDRLDILLLHSPPDNFDWIKYDASVLERLVRDGKVGRFGVSSHTVYGAQSVVESGFGQAVEVIFNAIDRRASDMVFNKDPDHFFSIGRVPLASGFLARKYLATRPSFQENDIRSQLDGKLVDWLLQTVKKLAFLDDLPGGLSISALRFAMSEANLDMVVPGMRSVEQVRDNLQAVELGLLPSEIIDKIADTIRDVPEDWKR